MMFGVTPHSYREPKNDDKKTFFLGLPIVRSPQHHVL